ncbi:2-phospho-L-lactate transferase [Methanobrevibacter sp. 87.7]|uniref:2-phospho-L-lactate transferase n=1 Tax=Methanobrevibacter sp. 87.7 TaxID=387957 RepID=UPI000B50FCE8|nr:2-phospho-L-lactate transferase [Methanobrevibacter sp. 87.7]OWT32886.1 2-phospho-L-lactate transferase [Methanobrevibacter sp. 87.7]
MKITVLSGGTGTPKLLQGLKEIVDVEDLSIIVNTVENNYFSGVYISGDIDVVMYTLIDMIDEEFWYGIKGDTYVTSETLKKLGCPEKLRIGDKDRAIMIQKTKLLKEGYKLSEIVDLQRKKLGIKSKVMPMSDIDSDIYIDTDIGNLDFHDFLIDKQCKPQVNDVVYSIVPPAPEVIDTIKNSDMVIIGPSNPITSIMPIVSIEGVKDALKNKFVVAISPMVGEGAVSGPASKFMNALGYEASCIGVAKLYSDFVDKLIIDSQDENLSEDVKNIIGDVGICNTMMKSLDIKKNLAKMVLDSYNL